MTNGARSTRIYPFSAIVGQDAMKSALILNAVNPHVGGVLISGEKGTAKSTAVRAFAQILPEIEVMDGCPYSCDPAVPSRMCPSCLAGPKTVRKRRVRLVELPLNATEDMVVGGLDFSASIRRGTRVFQPGLLARSHRGILYIDEVNLLPDHLADAILDAAASGENVIHREGISHRHQARFILVGTMNPEEGELRPQLTDRFGLSVEAKAERDIEARIEVMRRRDEFDRRPQEFLARFEQEDRRLAEKIARARELLPHVEFSPRLAKMVADLCVDMRAPGHRADVVTAHAAMALAAFEGRCAAMERDVRRAAVLATAHRSRLTADNEKSRKNRPILERPRSKASWLVNPELYPEAEPARAFNQSAGADDAPKGPTKKPFRRYDYPEAFFEVGPTYKVRKFDHAPDRLFRNGNGRRSPTRTRRRRGRYVRSVPQRLTGDVALDATLRAAAPYQAKRRGESDLTVIIHDEDIREKIRETRTGDFLLFVVDASGSMGAKGRMVASKGAIMSLLKDAYQKRDRVALVSFRQQEAVVNLAPTSSIYRAGLMLEDLPVGGKTPLAAGLAAGRGVLRNVLLKDPDCRPIAIIMTDGKANEGMGSGDPFWEALAAAKALAADRRVKYIVVDTEEEHSYLYGLSARLAEVLHADYFSLMDLRADVLLDIVRRER